MDRKHTRGKAMYLKLVVGVIIIAALMGGAWFSYNSGVNHERAEQAANRDKEAKKDEKKVEAVIKYREKIKVVYRDKIKRIKVAQDLTGCADVKLIDMGFGLHP